MVYRFLHWLDRAFYWPTRIILTLLAWVFLLAFVALIQFVLAGNVEFGP